MTDAVSEALSLGEIEWARRCAVDAVKVARKQPATLLGALRTLAELESSHADDTHGPDLVRAAKAWRAVAEHADASARDYERLAWAELMTASANKASTALDQAAALEPGLEFGLARAASAWVKRRTDEKRLKGLQSAALLEAERGNLEGLEHAVRLLLQADRCPLNLAEALSAGRASQSAAFAPARARAVALHVAALRSTGDADGAAELWAAWEREVVSLVPDPEDVRRHVLDQLDTKDPKAELERAARRVARVQGRYGASSPALEQPLALLARLAKGAGAFAQAVVPFEQLERLRGKAKSPEQLLQRHTSLGDLRDCLIALGHYEQALAVVEREEAVAVRRPGHLVPNHHARAKVFEAQGDWDRVLSEHAAAVSQYEAGPAPIYGPDAPNTELARGWARQAQERAARFKR